MIGNYKAEEALDRDTSNPAQNSWLQKSINADRLATDWFDGSIRANVEKNFDHFRSKHSANSKYTKASYRYRSRLFYPKTRGVLLKKEASAAVAYFSSPDIISVEARDTNNEKQRVAADVVQQLVNFRLEETLPWFQLLIGGYQNALTTGVVISKQWWEYEESEGEMVGEDEPQELLESPEEISEGEPEVKKDGPQITLIEIENLRIHPSADWIDPIGTSPFIQHIYPMYVRDVKDKIDDGEWLDVDDGQLMAESRVESDSVRSHREGLGRKDSKDAETTVDDWDVVWVTENIFREDDGDVIFYTLGKTALLSEPVPVTDVYSLGRRAFKMGYSLIETHRVYPAGLVDLLSPLQMSINTINNQRRDNVERVLNQQYLLRRDSVTDTSALKRNQPGGITYAKDPDHDIKVLQPPDVTRSSYEETDRLANEFDDISGSFSPASVQSNRTMGDTATGLDLLNQSSQSGSEYILRIFTATWVEDVLRDLAVLEQQNETDAVILALAGSKAQSTRNTGQEIDNEMLQGPLNIKVSVGFGNNNPQRRIEKLRTALMAVAEFAPDKIKDIKPEAVVREVFGAAGFRDGSIFFNNLDDAEKDPQVAQLEKMVEELTQVIQSEQVKEEAITQREEMKIMGAENRENIKGEYKLLEVQLKGELDLIDKELKGEVNEIEKSKLTLQRIVVQQKLLENKKNSILGKAGTGGDAGVLARDKFNKIPLVDDVGERA